MDDRDRSTYNPTAADRPATGWSMSEARDVADAARQRVSQVSRDTREMAAEAKEYVQDAVHQTRQYVGDAVQQARDKVAQYGEGGFDRVKDDVVGYTRQQPMTALLIAASAGLVLGWLSAAGRR